MPDDDDKMKVRKVIDLLNVAIPLQFRSAALFTWLAATATGVDVQAVGMKLEEFGRAELDDARRLIEKTAGLGAAATTDVASFEPVKLTKQGLGRIVKYEQEGLDALHRIIPETGQEARSEALEHLLEHIIMRKQQQVDFLERVRRGAG